MSQYPGQECLGALILRVIEHLVGFAFLDNLAFVNVNHPVGHLAGEAHFMGDDHHGHTFSGQLPHDIQYFPDHFRVQR